MLTLRLRPNNGLSVINHVCGISSTSPPSSHSQYDHVGPPHPVSNLRPVRFARPTNETGLAVRLRKLRQDTQQFNQEFWVEHNTSFSEGRRAYISRVMKEKYPGQTDKQTLTAEEMSGFYREFLNSNWKDHVKYNIEWQKRNWKIIGLGGLVQIQKLFRG